MAVKCLFLPPWRPCVTAVEGAEARCVLHAAKLVALAPLGRSTTRQAGVSPFGTPATRSNATGATERRFVAASHLGALPHLPRAAYVR